MRNFFPTIALALLCIPLADIAAQDDFEAFRRREAASLREFLSKDDAAFADFLKQDWKEFQLSVANRPLVRPKPRATPVARPTPAEVSAPPAPTVPPSPTPAPTPTPAEPPASSVAPPSLPGVVPSGSTVPSARRPAPPAPIALNDAGPTFTTAFFGSVVSVPKVTLKVQQLPATLTTQAISAFWEQMSASPYESVLKALHKQRDVMQLGDWAFAQLAYRTGISLTGGDTTLARLVAWHFLVKSGLATRVGFSGSSVHVLLRTDELLYGVSFFTINGARFYVLDLANGVPPRPGSIQTYERDHPDSKKALSFSMAALPLLPDSLEERTFRFEYKGRKHAINAGVNRNLVQFLSYYPQTQLRGYLDAEVPSAAMEGLVTGLRPVIAGRSELEQVDMLLRFVQTAFEYKTDGDQFAREKWMFPEETLFYPFSDCEDRAILFSYLVRQLVPSVSVVGLIYSDHVATAVKFNTAVSGDVRIHGGQRYVVSDPTYINASVGMEMPQYKEASPTIVDARALGR